MAGVPSSKACGSCHRMKKRCDQLKPTCTRCARLNIRCHGAGQQRYKFAQSSNAHIKNGTAASASGTTPDTQQTPPPPPSSSQAVEGILRCPSSDLAITVRILIATLQVTDLRFNLSCYGDFFDQIPARLGRNPAFDASVRALVSAFPFHHTGRLPREALVHYGEALSELRVFLSQNEEEELTAETLCAIYFVMICQGWIGRMDSHVKSHGEILAHLMSSPTAQNWRDGFELELLVAICVPVILEAMVNPAINLDVWFLNTAHDNGPAPPPRANNTTIDVPSIRLPKLARIPHLLRDPDLHQVELAAAYRDMRADHARLRAYLSSPPPSPSSSSRQKATADDHQHHNRQHNQYTVVYAVLLHLIASVSFMLRSMNPGSPALFSESIVIGTDIITLAERGLAHRPLGSSYMPPCLAIAWATVDDPHVRSESARLLREYQADFPTTRWMEQAAWLKQLMEATASRFALPVRGATPEPGDNRQMMCVSVAHHKAAFGLSGEMLFM